MANRDAKLIERTLKDFSLGAMSGEGGTTVVANPELSGDEADLTGLQVGDTKYKVPSGSGESNIIIDYDIYNLLSNGNEEGNYYISTTALLQLLTILGFSGRDNFVDIHICKILHLFVREEITEEGVDTTYYMGFFQTTMASVTNIRGNSFETVLGALAEVNDPIPLEVFADDFNGAYPLSIFVGGQCYQITKTQFDNLIVFVESDEPQE